jgi:hypothetical protein
MTISTTLRLAPGGLVLVTEALDEEGDPLLVVDTEVLLFAF